MMSHVHRRDRRVFASPRHARRSLLGFTLIEVLVTIAIVGVLAAIAVPVYLTQRRHAAGTSVQAEVQSAAVAYEQAITAGAVTKSIAGDGSKVAQAVADYGYTPSQDNQTWVSVDTDHPEQFCVLGDSTSSSWTSGDYVYYDSTTRSTTDTQPTSGPCAGVEAASAYQLTATPDLNAQAVPLAGDNPTGPSTGPGVGPAGDGSSGSTGTDQDLLDAINGLRCEQASGSPSPPVITGIGVAGTERNGQAEDVTYSSDGKLLAVADYSGNVLTYTVATDGVPAVAGIYPTGGHPYNVHFSPDGTLLAATGPSAVVMFKVASDGTLTNAGTFTLPGTNITAYDAAFSPNSNFLTVANWNSSQLVTYNVASTGLLSPIGTYTTYGNPREVAYSPDGKHLAVVDYGSSVLEMFTANGDGTLSNETYLTVATNPETLAFSPNGNLIVVNSYNSSSNEKIGTYTYNSSGLVGKIAGVIPGFGYGFDVAYAPNGNLIAASGTTGVVKLFTMNAGTPVAVTGGTFNVDSAANQATLTMAFSPNGEYLAVASLIANAVFTYHVSENNIC